jgi:hypothetical protein
MSGRDLSRRRLLARLGLATTLAYASPSVTLLSEARASERTTRPQGRARRTSLTTRPTARPSQPEFLVLVPPGTALTPIEALGYGILARRPNATLSGDVVRLSAPIGRTLAQARAEVTAALAVRAFDGNTLYRPNALLCEDGACMAFEMVDWQPRIGGCGLAPRIGMIDTGVKPEQPALAGQRLRILDLPRDGRAPSTALHGTAVATLLIGRADSRTPGLLPEAELVAVDAFFAEAGEDVADAFALAEAIDLLAGEAVDVINMSFAGPPNEILAALVARVAEEGTALVAAAGNNGPLADPAYPAAYPDVVAVTAVDRNERVYTRANQGDYIGFAAPGVELWTAASISGGRLRSGTSYAAPFVTAALAARRAEHPEEPIADSLRVLEESAVDLGPEGPDPVFGNGLVRASFVCSG